MEGWMNKKELAAYIGVKSVRTVDRWIGKNHLPKGKQFPTGPHWKKDIVDKWLDGFGQYEKQCNRQFNPNSAGKILSRTRSLSLVK